MAAEQGDLECQKFLGREYYERKDYDTSFKWFAMAAEQGDLECQSFLGIEYYKRKDYTVALKWLFKAAEQNDSVSQKFLGWSYWSKNDNDNALKWYGKAAQQGDNEALFGVGIILLTKGDVTQAISYFQDAANKGFYRAAFWLGEIYFYGRGVQKDNQTALEWYARAADSGHIYAQRMVLRINYIRGAGISKIICCIKAIFLGVKFFVIAMKDRHDPRLGDIPGWGDFWIKR
jgi:TPR repeat protein